VDLAHAALQLAVRTTALSFLLLLALPLPLLGRQVVLRLTIGVGLLAIIT
jgi:hypothetical protein